MSAESPRVSVIVPTYNQGDLLRHAVASVLAQTEVRFELLIVDNSSIDNTADVIRSFDDRRIRSFTVQNDGVIAVSRNTGIRASSAPLLAFLDSDDVWRPQKLARALDCFKSDPGIGLVCHAEALRKNGRITRVLRYGPWQPDMERRLLARGNCLSTSAVVVRRSLAVESGGFSERPDYVTAEDYDLWIRLASRCRFAFLEDVLGEYVLHQLNMSAATDRHLRNQANVASDHVARLRDRRLARRVQGRFDYMHAQDLHRRGAVRQSLPRYGKALLRNPALVVRSLGELVFARRQAPAA